MDPAEVRVHGRCSITRRGWLTGMAAAGRAAASTETGLPLPDLVVRTNRGGALRLSDWRRRLVIANFWATWCGPCRKEMSEIQAFLDGRPEGVAVLGIALDQRGWAAVTPFLREHGIRFPVCLADRRILRAFGFYHSPEPIPQTLVFSGSGERVLHVRTVLTEPDFERIARIVLGDRSPR